MVTSCIKFVAQRNINLPSNQYIALRAGSPSGFSSTLPQENHQIAAESNSSMLIPAKETTARFPVRYTSILGLL